MLLQLTIDRFLDELINAYGRIASRLYPKAASNREYNPQYKIAHAHYKYEQTRLYKYLNNGFFINEESRQKIQDSLETALELLHLIGPDDSSGYESQVHRQLTTEVTRLLEMVKLIDVLEDA